MDNYDQLHQEGIHPSPCQQDLLLAALSSTPSQKSKDGLYQANFEQGILPGHASSQNPAPPHWCSLDNIQLHATTFDCSDDGSSLLDYKSMADFELRRSVDLIGNLLTARRMQVITSSTRSKNQQMGLSKSTTKGRRRSRGKAGRRYVIRSHWIQNR